MCVYVCVRKSENILGILQNISIPHTQTSCDMF